MQPEAAAEGQGGGAVEGEAAARALWNPPWVRRMLKRPQVRRNTRTPLRPP